MDIFLKGTSLLLPSQLSYRWNLKTCDALLTLSHSLQVALNRDIGERLVQLDFSAAFYRVSNRGVLYKLNSIGVGGQILLIVSEFLSDRRQRVRLAEEVSASVDVIRG